MRPELEALDRCDGCRAIAHALIEGGCACVGGVMFQRCELRALAAAPVFRRSKQLCTDALVLVAGAYRDFRDVAVDHLSVHWVRGVFEPGIDESDDFTTEFGDESDV